MTVEWLIPRCSDRTSFQNRRIWRREAFFLLFSFFFLMSTNWLCLTRLSVSDMCIASAISLLMILICGMATYGAYKVNQWYIRPNIHLFLFFLPVVVTAGQTHGLLLYSLILTTNHQLSNPNLCVSAASCLDHPIFLLPNFWLCSQHISCCEHCGLPKYHTRLPAATGEKPLGMVLLKLGQVCVASVLMITWWHITLSFTWQAFF